MPTQPAAELDADQLKVSPKAGAHMSVGNVGGKSLVILTARSHRTGRAEATETRILGERGGGLTSGAHLEVVVWVRVWIRRWAGY
jgi:hypothetical protein